LETTVTSLLLVTAAVVLACVVVNYAVTTVQQALNTDNIPQLDGIKNIENNLLNQTDQLFNETQPQSPSIPSP
jgi:predicted PurR-regulated permease PerM